jgi:hypothetical protein
MLTIILAAAATLAAGTGAYLQLRARLARARRLYDPVFYARRMALGGSAGAVFRRSAT